MCFLVNVTILYTSQVAMLALYLMNETSATSTNFAKKKPKCSSVIYQGALYKVTFVFLVPIYSICKLFEFVVRMLPASDLAASLIAVRLSHMALLLRDSILVPIIRLLTASSMVSLLKWINFYVRYQQGNSLCIDSLKKREHS